MARSEEAVVRPAVTTHRRQTMKTGRFHVTGASPEDARHFCFVLHGYGQLAARILRHFEGIIPPGVCVVAPEALNRFYTVPLSTDRSHMERVGATWLTRDDREYEIADTMAWLDLVHDEVIGERGASTSTSIVAFSQGVATSMRWLMLGKAQPTHFIMWAGSFATDMDQQEFANVIRSVDTTFVCGTRDEFFSAEQLTAMSTHLDRIGVAHRVRRFDGTHTLDRDVLAELLAEVTRDVVR